MSDAASIISAIAGLASVFGVLILGGQLMTARNQQLMTYFSQYNDRYDQIVNKIPLSILLDNRPKTLDDPTATEDIERFIYDYLALCEEELDLLDDRAKPLFPKLWPWRSAEKLWAETEREWKLGMRDNCRLDIFQNCIVDFYGRYLKGDPSRHANGQFEKLRKLLAEESTRNAN
jgi:hypothetical protein